MPVAVKRCAAFPGPMRELAPGMVVVVEPGMVVVEAPVIPSHRSVATPGRHVNTSDVDTIDLDTNPWLDSSRRRV